MEVANFCAAMDTLIDQDGTLEFHVILRDCPELLGEGGSSSVINNSNELYDFPLPYLNPE